MVYILLALALLLLQTFIPLGYESNYLVIFAISILPLIYSLYYSKKIPNVIPILLTFFILRLILFINYNDYGSDDRYLEVSFIKNFIQLDYNYLLKLLYGEIYYYPITVYYVSIPKLLWGEGNETILIFNLFHVLLFISIIISVKKIDKKEISNIIAIILLNPIFLMVTSNINRDIYIFIGLALLVAYYHDDKFFIKLSYLVISSVIFFLTRLEYLLLIPIVIIVDNLKLDDKKVVFITIILIIILVLIVKVSILYLFENIIKSMLSPFPWYNLKALESVSNNYSAIGIPFHIVGSILTTCIIFLFTYLVFYFKKLNLIDKKMVFLAFTIIGTLSFSSLGFNRYLLPSVLIMSIVLMKNRILIGRKIIEIAVMFSIIVPIILNVIWYFYKN